MSSAVRKALGFRIVPTTAELQGRLFKPGTKVRLVDDIPGYRAGTRGKVALANGITWKRYWVRFPDGSSTGYVGHESLVGAKNYDTFLVAREREVVEAAAAAEAAAEAGTNAPTADSGGALAAESNPMVNGIAVPQRLLDMSAAARIRLGA